MNVYEIFSLIESTFAYRIAMVFYGLYPIFMAIVWVVMSTIYFRRRERGDDPQSDAAAGFLPFVSIVIPAYAEEKTIGGTLDALLALDYPDYEIIVVNDGSPDATAEIVTRYVAGGRVRLVDKKVNEGKAMALNDALPLCKGEIITIVDADIIVTPQLLRALVPHFLHPRVGAITGNPRVANRGSLLRNLQAIEFSSIISVQRRAQRIWGRVLTVSGAVMAVRRTALLEVGLFAPNMATEDIDLTWRLQRHFWDVRYEPAAIVWMQVPPTLGELWKQRRRWARGLAQVLKKHRGVVRHWKYRRLWPVFFEASLSIAWAYTFLLLTSYWIVALILGHEPYGASPIPNVWGMMIGTACLVQLFSGAIMDRHYDRRLMRAFPVAVFYPLIYWMLMSLITSIYTIGAFVTRPPEVQRWRIERVAR